MRGALSIVVPFKGRAGAKSRLASRLSAEHREALAFSMADHVLSVCAPYSTRLFLVSACEAASALGARHGAKTIVDRRGAGTAAAYEQALEQLGQGEPRLLVNADLPSLTGADIEEMIAAPNVLAIAPDRYGVGTNALYLPFGVSLPLRFGPESFVRHQSSARDAGLRIRIVRREALAADVDEPADLDAASPSLTAQICEAGRAR